MSKEFQIRDGNLIASFDLENEDGDIDCCKLLKVSHGVADEIGMFVDYVATNKIIKDQSNQIADLEAKLAVADDCADRYWKQLGVVEDENEELKQQLTEKEKEIIEYVKINDVLHSGLSERCINCEEEHNQDKISFAVEQLEKVKEWCEDNCDTYDNDAGKVIGLDNVIYTADMPLYDYIDNQIKQLKEQQK